MDGTADTVDIRLEQGTIRGLRRGTGGRGATFRGIPYAAPPVGGRRFLAPEAPEPWDGVRDATRVGPTAPQRGASPVLGQLIPNVSVPGDDYLHVNVETPDLDGSAPVLVFLHGGSFVTGSNALDLYEGAAFARDGIVYVAVNYRLGIDGFLLLEDAPANRGLLDQIAALRWVGENIARFGGDPDRVTVMGESAGAMSVATLLAVPAARGLFHRAILQSGGDGNALSVGDAVTVRDRVAELLGVAPVRDAVSGVPDAEFPAVQEQLQQEVGGNASDPRWREIARQSLPFEPVIDGEVLPEAPSAVIGRGDVSGIDILTGYNLDEAKLFFFPMPENGVEVRRAAEGFGHLHGLSDSALEEYWDARQEGDSDRDVFARIGTDLIFAGPAHRIAGSPGTRYLYRFGWRSTAEGGRMGAAHAFELPFVFDALDSPDAAGILDGARPQAIADRMHGAWVRFVTEGHPGWSPYGDGGGVHLFGGGDAVG